MIDEKSLTTLEYDKILDELARHAQTSPGRALCIELLPSSDFDEVAARQLETDHAVRVVLERGAISFSGISDIRPSLVRSQTGALLTPAELLRIAAFLRAVARIRAWLPDDGGKDPDTLPFRVYDRVRQLQPVRSLLLRLEECIAGEEEFHDRATESLYNIRRRIKDTQNAVKDHLGRIIRSHANALQEQLVTMRGDRYVVPVKADHRGNLPGIVHDTSSSGATLFVEPIAVVELNNKIRELKSRERDEIEKILQELTAMTAGSSDILLTDASLLSELDFVMAKAELAVKMKAMPPVINREGRILLKAARHPLIPPDRVVPIDLNLGVDFHTLVITGPNTGGKTVTLKTCGLFCLIAMAGLQIPAKEGSELSVFDQILADIGDEQSIEQDLSTFSSHLCQLIRITEKARPGTLVLVDELGSGTDPSEGAALAIALLDYLHRHGCLTVATTHYKELKGYAIQTEDVENACCEFDTETLRPTYRLLIGVPGVSNAFAISRRLGLDPAIIDHAITLISEEGMQFEELVQSIEKSRSEADRLREEAQRMHEEARQLRDSLAHQNAAQEERKRDLAQKAREEARELYQEAEQDIQNQLEALKQQIKKQDVRHQHHLITQTRQQLRSGRGQIENQIGAATLHSPGESLPLDRIETGDLYAAPHLGLVGKLIDGPDARNQVTLQVGSMKVTVSVETLRLPETDRSDISANGSNRSGKKSQSSTGPEIERGFGRRKGRLSGSDTNRLTRNASLHATTEIKLLGQTVEEARANLDQFLDQAVLSGISQLRVVHGKGTGALRAAVQQMLKSDSRVKAYRLAAYGEGDSGVTIVELK